MWQGMQHWRVLSCLLYLEKLSPSPELAFGGGDTVLMALEQNLTEQQGVNHDNIQQQQQPRLFTK